MEAQLNPQMATLKHFIQDSRYHLITMKLWQIHTDDGWFAGSILLIPSTPLAVCFLHFLMSWEMIALHKMHLEAELSGSCRKECVGFSDRSLFVNQTWGDTHVHLFWPGCHSCWHLCILMCLNSEKNLLPLLCSALSPLFGLGDQSSCSSQSRELDYHIPYPEPAMQHRSLTLTSS